MATSVPSLHLAHVNDAQAEAVPLPHIRAPRSERTDRSNLDAVSLPSHATSSTSATAADAHLHPPRRTRWRTTPLCICLPATFIILLVVFAGSLSAAVITWRHYDSLRSKDEWLLRSCAIQRAWISRDKTAKLNSTHAWRAQARVYNYGLRNATEQVVAYWGATPSYTLTKNEAKGYIEITSEGEPTKCWVFLASLRKVSLLEIRRNRKPSEEMYLNLAWGTSFFAAISGFLLVTLTISVLQRALLHATGEVPHMEERRAKRAVLSPAQARFVLTEFASEGAALPGWTCSICLEDAEDAGSSSRLRIVILPCQHAFHSRCIRKWLRRGSPTCPLCNWDVQLLFNEDGLPVDKNGHVLLSPQSRTRQLHSSAQRLPSAPRDCDDVAVPLLVARRAS